MREYYTLERRIRLMLNGYDGFVDLTETPRERCDLKKCQLQISTDSRRNERK